MVEEVSPTELPRPTLLKLMRNVVLGLTVVNQKSGFSPVLCLQGGGVEGGKDLTPNIERVDPVKPRIPENDIVPDT